jgi:hypothetical protein
VLLAMTFCEPRTNKENGTNSKKQKEARRHGAARKVSHGKETSGPSAGRQKVKELRNFGLVRQRKHRKANDTTPPLQRKKKTSFRAELFY